MVSAGWAQEILPTCCEAAGLDACYNACFHESQNDCNWDPTDETCGQFQRAAISSCEAICDENIPLMCDPVADKEVMSELHVEGLCTLK
ncbi:MAG: hypothetical protein COA52_10405 [Hyphomicrobiales bacterium]|nr:MAG: hypothetical protein COA52_10405 [Hyphomicrobiales bacterium]